MFQILVNFSYHLFEIKIDCSLVFVLLMRSFLFSFSSSSFLSFFPTPGDADQSVRMLGKYLTPESLW